MPTDNSDKQLFANGAKTMPVYGYGSSGYGIDAVRDRGRKAHVQFREQNSGFTPSEDYRTAKFLPGLWRDLDRNGCTYTMPGGIMMGLATVEVPSTSATVFARLELCHQLMPANAGIRQKLFYGEMDKGVAVDIDSFVTGTPGTNGGVTIPSSLTRIVTSKYGNNQTSAYVGGNAPIGYNITHALSTAWEDVFANQKYAGALTVKTHWNNMYPVDTGFTYGIPVVPVGTHTVTSLSAGVVNGSGVLQTSTTAYVVRSELGFSEMSYVCGTAVSIEGMYTGAMLMPNPWLPGTLMTVKDFANMVASADATDVVAIQVAAQLGVADPLDLTVAEAMTYGLMHRVGRCLKRQTRAYANEEGNSGVSYLSKHDIYAANYKYMVTVPGLGLSGSESEGIEADQEAASQFAKKRAADSNTETGVDVFFANLMII